MQSVVTFEKPLPHLSASDWDAALYGLQGDSTARRTDSFDLRYGSQQFRNENKIKTQWDVYHNDNRLKSRIREMKEWRAVLQGLMNRLNDELAALQDSKASTERELEQLNIPLLMCSESLSTRDGRPGSELTYDIADTELKKELCVTESNKKMLIDRCQATWEKINRLLAVRCKLQLHLNDQTEAIAIDEEALNINENSASVTYKRDALKTPIRMLTYEQWIKKSSDIKRIATDELADTLKARETLFIAKSRARNMLRAQMDSTNYMLRRRIYEMQRARNELQWQKRKMEEEMQKLSAEIHNLEEQLLKNNNARKVAETKIETRGNRPGVELAADEAHVGLKEEVVSLRKTIYQTQDKLNCCKATYNALESGVNRLSQDLANKDFSLDIDIKILEGRVAIESKKPEGTEKNLVLANIDNEEPKHIPGAN